MFEIKRIYDDYSVDDGFRVLIDRLWPRGVSRASARLDLWAKSIAPSALIRKRFAHQEDRWEQFEEDYLAELDANKSGIRDFIVTIGARPRVTLLYGAKDPVHNHAVILRQYLDNIILHG